MKKSLMFLCVMAMVFVAAGTAGAVSFSHTTTDTPPAYFK